MGYRIQNRRDTAANWAEMNPILLEGEIGIVTDNPNQYKVGDGINTWNNLPLRGFTGTIAQVLGEDENAVVSQKTVTEKFGETDVRIFELGSSERYVRSVLNGYISIDDGRILTSNSNNTVYSDVFYKVKNNHAYTLAGLNELLLTVSFYDKDKKYIGYDAYFTAHDTFTAPSNVEYVRLSLRHPSSTLTRDTYDYNIWIEDIDIVSDDILTAFQGKRVSIIGDSISTYNKTGYKIDGYQTFYPHYDVDNVNKTWWLRLFNVSGSSMEVNASYSGSCVTDVREGKGYPTLCDRVPLLGNPDTIIIALGTNDGNDNAPLGDYDFNSAAEDLSESTFRTAYIKGIKMLNAAYPNAKIVIAAFRMNLNYVTSIEHIADYFNLDIVINQNYESSDSRHPTLKGMKEIAHTFANIDIENKLRNQIESYGTLLTPFTYDLSTLTENEEFFTIENDVLSSHSILYLFIPSTARIFIPVFNVNIGLADGSGTKFIVFNRRSYSVESINPGDYGSYYNGRRYNLIAIVQRLSNLEYRVKTSADIHNVVDRSFDGVYKGSTLDSTRKQGVYIRKIAGSTRGGVLFVSVTDGVVSQTSMEINTSGNFEIKERTYDNNIGAWGDWVSYRDTRYTRFPPVSINGDVVFENDSIKFVGSAAYIYRYGSRSNIASSGTRFPLTQTSGITRLCWDSVLNTITDEPINSFFDENKKVTIGFIVRDSDGNIKKLVSNFAAQHIVYPIEEKSNAKSYKPSEIKYIPHRGIRDSEIPENTSYSVIFAALYGLKHAECDVRYTSDGIGVIMHDTTINRTMYNSDLSAISGNVTIADNTYEDLSQYVYKSTNEVYRTRLQTMKEYIDACAQWDICPIIQGSMSDDDLSYCMQRLGDNWICYGGNFTKVRSYSQNVLCLTSASYDSVDAMVTALNSIGGNVGLSRLYNDQLTDDYIAACKSRGWEVMASYAYQHQNIPDAIRRGATIVLSDNVGKDTNKVLASSLKDWSKFTHTGVILNGGLVLSSKQYLKYSMKGKGSYKIYAQFEGEGTITLPNYSDTGVYGSLTFPMTNGTFVYTLSKLDDSDYMLSIDTSSELVLKRLLVFYEEVSM